MTGKETPRRVRTTDTLFVNESRMLTVIRDEIAPEIRRIEEKAALRLADVNHRIAAVGDAGTARADRLSAEDARLQREMENAGEEAKLLALNLRDHVAEIARLHEIAHTREHELNDRSADKESHALNARLDTMNAFRAQIEAERVTYVTREFLGVELRRIAEHSDQADAKGGARSDALSETVTSKISVVQDLIGSRADGNLRRIESIENQLVVLTTRTAEMGTLAMDVRELRDFRSTAQGRGAVLTVVTSSIVGLLVSIVASLVLYALTHH